MPAGESDSFAPDFVGPRHRLRESLLLKTFLPGRPGKDVLNAGAGASGISWPGGVLAVSVPANPKYFGPSDRWAGHVRRYTREALLDAITSAGFTVERCNAWGFPVSTLYHRYVYDPRLARRGAAPPGRGSGPALTALGLLLELDRLFVGVERGALGYLVLARK